MNIVDVIILIFLIFGTLVGFKRGIISQAFSLVGILVILYLSFLLKNPLSHFMYEHLPFFDFFGFFEEIRILNVVFYEAIAFLLVFSILLVIFRILLKITKIVDKLIKMTIILAIPSKIGGAILGFLEYYLIVFAFLFIVTLPIFNFDGLQDSKMKDTILNHTPFLSSYTKKYTKVADEFYVLKKDFQKKKDSNKFQLEILNTFLKYDILTPDSAQMLVDSKKIEIDGAEELIEAYSSKT